MAMKKDDLLLEGLRASYSLASLLESHSNITTKKGSHRIQGLLEDCWTVTPQGHGQWRLTEDGLPVWSLAEASTQYSEQMREDSPDGSVVDHSSIARGSENSPIHGLPAGESPAPDLVMNDPAGPSSPVPVAPRRSKRLQEARLNAGRKAIEVVIDDPPKPKATKRKRAGTNNRKAASSAKPQGVSKAEGSTKRKRRARKG
ncbi:hypothetical protein GGR55DRAFT_680817 [Xylaria sp. FL0064]|nr:hypothetical protein GGR55DRAFT_680817 [Xylaria sp. FL0064]